MVLIFVPQWDLADLPQGEFKMNDWMQTGSTEDARKKAKEEEESNFSVPRFWIEPGDKKRIIFLDDSEVCIYEHLLKVGENRYESYTCPRGMLNNPDVPCPLCDARNRRMYVGFVTVIDVNGYTDKKGNKHTFIRKLFPMGTTVLERFVQRKKDPKGNPVSLVGVVMDVSRTTKNAPRLGDDWQQVGTTNILTDVKLQYKSKADNKMHAPEPFDYKKILKPLPADELRRILALPPSGSAKSGDDYSGDGTYTPPSGGGDGDALY